MTAWTIYTNANLLFDKNKNRKLVKIWPSLHFYGMIILVKIKPFCTGMAKRFVVIIILVTRDQLERCNR